MIDSGDVAAWSLIVFAVRRDDIPCKDDDLEKTLAKLRASMRADVVAAFEAAGFRVVPEAP
jgi:hypothetical protein